MKKLICLVLALVSVLSLSSCFLLAKDEGEDTTAKGSLPSYVGQEVKEFDENGDLILTSSDNRHVYSYDDGGLVVFVFIGDAVSKIQRVFVFDSTAAAEEYVTDLCVAAVEGGEIPPRYTIRGNYAIIEVAFSTDQESLGFYYTRSKAQIINDFAAKEESIG